jgi:hypothetical protein
MKLLTTADRSAYFTNDSQNVYEENDVPGVFMESCDMRYAFRGKVRIERIRRIPSPLNVNLSLPLNLPPSVNPQNLPQSVQQLLQQMVQQGGSQLQPLIEAEIARQSPVQGINARWVGGVWRREA